MSIAIAPPAYISLAVKGDPDASQEEAQKIVVETMSKLDELDRDRAWNTVMDSEANQKLMKEHIEKLASETLAVRKAFEDIYHLLGDFDAYKFKDSEGNELEPLQPGWNGLRVEYNKLLSDSKEDAILIKGICDRYIETILGMLEDKTVTKEDLLKELEYFIKETKKSQAKAKGNADDWDNLRVSVNTYQTQIELAFKSARPDVDKSAVEEKIRELKLKIADAEKFISNCVIAGGVGLAATVGGAILCCFCPWAAVLFVGGVLTMLGSAVAYSVKQRELDESAYCTSLLDDKAELKKQETELQRLEDLEETRTEKLNELKQQLVDSKGDFEAITLQLAALANFWQSVHSDLQGALTHIGDLDPEEITLYGLKSRAGPRLAGSVYIVLSKVLGTYVSQMTSLDENTDE
ncbi:hypothetical protein SCHPADRAFT_890856 [Schizopora paradoxa]|uniref:Uncharacterized protein n=1 Tax=Schizopora paradoxa TaxID=27342 RepID=A0A0H2RL56_9AGAM|nr:hypothetical protein SCHPADRAFT_890856 [Schizopora paradoxa]